MMTDEGIKAMVDRIAELEAELAAFKAVLEWLHHDE
jgi:hypothetical protein